MNHPNTQAAADLVEPPLVGDHLALDLLNTTARNDGDAIEFWNHGDDVLRWLERHGLAPAPGSPPLDSDALLAQGLALRALARRLIAERKEKDAVGDIGGLNQFLQAYVSAPQLERNADGDLVLARVARSGAPASVLGPVAEAVAQLLVEGDFVLVKQCEHPDCVLWFYDRTKAHKRRWCSMALCGNRYKAAQFRKKKSGAEA